MKKLISFLLALATVFGLLLIMPFSAAADSLCIKKIVSVVYDDSTSMTWDSSHDPYWPSANYAMQAFCGMLNSEDQLYVTYMSGANKGLQNYQPEKLELSADRIQQSADSVRDHTSTGSTPFDAVRIAFDKLKNVKDSDHSTQYWLVVITDGDFNNEPNDPNGWKSSWDTTQKKDFLNKTFAQYCQTEMPNGSRPQVTYLGIGNVVKPDKTESVHPYASKGESEIIATMSEMADKISGRTRLSTTETQLTNNGKTVSFTTNIPLSNVAVLVQGSDASVSQCHPDSSSITQVPITRRIRLDFSSYSGKTYDQLRGTAFLLGDSVKVIPKGTYEVDFDTAVDLKNVVLLLEPALEVRMSITANGKEVSDISVLDTLCEQDVISVTCKVYEKGTDTEIAASNIPGGVIFDLSVSEDGKVISSDSGQGAKLTDYVLKNVKTELAATMHISGFNPIRTAVTFTPDVYVPKIVYTITPSFGSDQRSVKFDDIASNQALSVCFSVCADGVPITDPAALKALSPTIEISPEGNAGIITYSDDGKIVFTPDSAKEPASHDGSYKVTVTCTLEDGTSASETYTVLLSEYKVIAVNGDKSVKKTKLFQNGVGVSFYITKDGVKLDKAAVQEDIFIQLNKEHKNLKTKMTISEDGTITVVPYSTKNDPLTFMKWHYNWRYYFSLEGKDIQITLDHPFGAATATIDIVEEDMSYLLLHVYLPLGLEILGAIILALYIYCLVTKPRFLKSAKLYAGRINYDETSGTHFLTQFTAVNLSKYNRIKKGNGRLAFKKKASVVKPRGIKVRADHGGRIVCEEVMPWYAGCVEVVDTDLQLNTPADIAEYIKKSNKLEINEFEITETIKDNYNRTLTPGNIHFPRYIVIPTSAREVKVIGGRKVIYSGKIFIYMN